ncbi:MAG: Gfo/Idh/MocA family protein [Bacteroidota bacterium]
MADINPLANLTQTRRTFIKTTGLATAGLMAAGNFAFGGTASDRLRIGLIGCGGRGTGAARDAVTADPRVDIVAMGDVFRSRVDESRERLAEEIPDNLKVTDETAFVGFDAYQHVIASDVDMVILATPPGFRPEHLEAAISAGKHVFMEKPVAVDPVGIRSVIASSNRADELGLCIVAGTQRRHDLGYRAAIEQIHDGAIGEVLSGQVFWNQGGLWMHERQPEWTDMEWQLRNWLYFTWLSGDHIVEQHVHQHDVTNWIMQSHPVRAVGMGGRQARVQPAYGHIYDHFAIDYEYPNGGRVMSMCRQIDGCVNNVSEHFIGTKGTTNAASWIRGENTWRRQEEPPNPYVQEHVHLMEAIRSGNTINEGRQVAESTLTAIMGREAAYTGQEITWDQIYNSNQTLRPSSLEWGPMPVAPVAVPGQTQVERTA